MNSVYISRPYQTPSIKITSDSANILELICLQYGDYITDAKLDCFFEITALVDTKDRFLIKYEDISMYSDNPLQEINNLIFVKTQYDKNVLALHAAAVKYNDNAHLLIAPTTAGKTTLTSFLSSSGFDYITDDCVLLLKDELLVHPYTTPIQLRCGGVSVLKACNKLHAELVTADIPNNKRYVYTPGNCVKEPLPLGNIYFINRTEKENTVVDLTVTEAITGLMQSPITNYQVTSDYLRFLSGLAKKGCKKLLYKDMGYVSEIIRKEG